MSWCVSYARSLGGFVGCRSSWKHPLPSFSKDLTQTKTTSSHTTSSPSFSPPLIQMVNEYMYIDTLHRQTHQSFRFLFKMRILLKNIPQCYPGDHSVTRSEFEHGWTSSGFGTSTEADTLFTALDTDHDGRITASHDLNSRFTALDVNREFPMLCLVVRFCFLFLFAWFFLFVLGFFFCLFFYKFCFVCLFVCCFVLFLFFFVYIIWHQITWTLT